MSITSLILLLVSNSVTFCRDTPTDLKAKFWILIGTLLITNVMKPKLSLMYPIFDIYGIVLCFTHITFIYMLNNWINYFFYPNSKYNFTLKGAIFYYFVSAVSLIILLLIHIYININIK